MRANRLIAALDGSLLWRGGCSQSAIDRRLRKPSPPNDFRNGRASLPERPNFFNGVGQKKRFAPEPHASFLGLGDAIHLALMADVVLELCNQRQDAHDQLAGARACVDDHRLP